MGNCFSSQESNAIALRNLVQRPGSPEIVLTAATINQGLNEVARTLNRNRRNVTIVAVGGAVNTLYLRSRAQTTDVDFFYRTKERHEDVSAIIQAARGAARQIRVGEGWLNNHTAIFISVCGEISLFWRIYNQMSTHPCPAARHDRPALRRGRSTKRSDLPGPRTARLGRPLAIRPRDEDRQAG